MKPRDMGLSAAKFCHGSLCDRTDTANDNNNHGETGPWLYEL